MAIRQGAFLSAVLLASALGGCGREYIDRSDTITPGSGDAVRANIVAHVIDPWPRSASNTNIIFSGERMVDAVRSTRAGDPPAGGGVAAPAASRAKP